MFGSRKHERDRVQLHALPQRGLGMCRRIDKGGAARPIRSAGVTVVELEGRDGVRLHARRVIPAMVGIESEIEAVNRQLLRIALSVTPFARVERFVDRAKDALRRRGENILPLEAAAAIRLLPTVAGVVVICVTDDVGVDDEVNAVVTSRAEAARLIECLRPNVPHFMLSRHVRTVPEAPRTPPEKFKSHRLRTMGETPGFWDREQSNMRQASHWSEARD